MFGSPAMRSFSPVLPNTARHTSSIWRAAWRYRRSLFKRQEMPELCAFDYAVIRVVPHVEREEFVNVGVILFCSTRRFLDVRIRLDEARLKSLSPELDMVQVRDHLDLITRVAAGEASAGPLGQLSRFERFQWLVSPRSTT